MYKFTDLFQYFFILSVGARRLSLRVLSFRSLEWGGKSNIICANQRLRRVGGHRVRQIRAEHMETLRGKSVRDVLKPFEFIRILSADVADVKRSRACPRARPRVPRGRLPSHMRCSPSRAPPVPEHQASEDRRAPMVPGRKASDARGALLVPRHQASARREPPLMPGCQGSAGRRPPLVLGHQASEDRGGPLVPGHQACPTVGIQGLKPSPEQTRRSPSACDNCRTQRPGRPRRASACSRCTVVFCVSK